MRIHRHGFGCAMLAARLSHFHTFPFSRPHRRKLTVLLLLSELIHGHTLISTPSAHSGPELFIESEIKFNAHAHPFVYLLCKHGHARTHSHTLFSSVFSQFPTLFHATLHRFRAANTGADTLINFLHPDPSYISMQRKFFEAMVLYL